MVLSFETPPDRRNAVAGLLPVNSRKKHSSPQISHTDGAVNSYRKTPLHDDIARKVRIRTVADVFSKEWQRQHICQEQLCVWTARSIGTIYRKSMKSREKLCELCDRFRGAFKFSGQLVPESGSSSNRPYCQSSCF